MNLRHAAALAIRPSNVVRFERLMYLAVGINVILTMWRWDLVLAQAPSHPVTVALGNIFGFATDVLFIWLVARRHKKWPRWLMLCFFILGMPFAAGQHQWLRAHPVNSVLICVMWLAQIVALFLIFTGNSREWFVNDPVGQIIPAN